MILPPQPEQLKLSEIFFSIQGEGLRAGMPCIFVRLHGCGLRCSWCDTPYALSHRDGGEWKSFDEIRREIKSYPCRFVEFTGGEPLEQPEVHQLIRQLLDDGYTVAVETGGHVDISDCDPRLIRILDLKAPDSGMTKRNRYENIEHLSDRDEIKFVCASINDYEWAKELILQHNLSDRVAAVLISPVFDKVEPLHLVEAILRDGLNVRFQLQLHKFIWEPDARGV
ncbi:MAG: radical SAM protein [Ignavibacteriae bacterium]|nr:radical SAM protein [Ignavibacteriota bacterium]MCB9217422.1 radical SAM protein [Ignavibacteria bacterium]